MGFSRRRRCVGVKGANRRGDERHATRLDWRATRRRCGRAVPTTRDGFRERI
uniref:Uncharacterized protein n=1 Tax=uncultured marine virus TaxID=186617 RepID=A0A0F7LBA6_9VIRU|nr:hypothetical protein [uncultured marine virus]